VSSTTEVTTGAAPAEQRKRKRGRPVLSDAERAVKKDREFLLALHHASAEQAKANAAAIQGLTRALEAWFEMFKVSSAPAQGWTNTETTEWARYKAQEEGLPPPDPTLSEPDQVRWLMKQMDEAAV